MTATGSIRAHPERAEPRSIGTSGGRDTLAREVRLLGALLGEIILEQAGPEVFDVVESTRARAIAARRSAALRAPYVDTLSSSSWSCCARFDSERRRIRQTRRYR